MDDNLDFNEVFYIKEECIEFEDENEPCLSNSDVDNGGSLDVENDRTPFPNLIENANYFCIPIKKENETDKFASSSLNNEPNDAQGLYSDIDFCVNIDENLSLLSSRTKSTAKTNRKRKLKSKNEKVKILKCKLCLYKGSKAGLQGHWAWNHAEKKFKCDKCSYSAPFSSHLKLHKKTHLRESNKKSKSDFSTDLSSDLKDSEKINVEKVTKKRSSEQLDFSLHSSKPNRLRTSIRTSSLKNIKNTKNLNKKYKCEHCNFSACSPNLLKIHNKIHRSISGKKRCQSINSVIYRCNECQYSTKYDYLLVCHKKRTHFHDAITENPSRSSILTSEANPYTNNNKDQESTTKQSKTYPDHKQSTSNKTYAVLNSSKDGSEVTDVNKKPIPTDVQPWRFTMKIKKTYSLRDYQISNVDFKNSQSNSDTKKNPENNGSKCTSDVKEVINSNVNDEFIMKDVQSRSTISKTSLASTCGSQIKEMNPLQMGSKIKSRKDDKSSEYCQFKKSCHTLLSENRHSKQISKGSESDDRTKDSQSTIQVKLKDGNSAYHNEDKMSNNDSQNSSNRENDSNFTAIYGISATTKSEEESHSGTYKRSSKEKAVKNESSLGGALKAKKQNIHQKRFNEKNGDSPMIDLVSDNDLEKDPIREKDSSLSNSVRRSIRPRTRKSRGKVSAVINIFSDDDDDSNRFAQGVQSFILSSESVTVRSSSTKVVRKDQASLTNKSSTHRGSKARGPSTSFQEHKKNKEKRPSILDFSGSEFIEEEIPSAPKSRKRLLSRNSVRSMNKKFNSEDEVSKKVKSYSYNKAKKININQNCNKHDRMQVIDLDRDNDANKQSMKEEKFISSSLNRSTIRKNETLIANQSVSVAKVDELDNDLEPIEIDCDADSFRYESVCNTVSTTGYVNEKVSINKITFDSVTNDIPSTNASCGQADKLSNNLSNQETESFHKNEKIKFFTHLLETAKTNISDESVQQLFFDEPKIIIRRSRILRCTNCLFISCSKKQMSHHRLSVHFTSKKFQCSKCEFICCTKRVWSKHQLERHNQTEDASDEDDDVNDGICDDDDFATDEDNGSDKVTGRSKESSCNSHYVNYESKDSDSFANNFQENDSNNDINNYHDFGEETKDNNCNVKIKTKLKNKLSNEGIFKCSFCDFSSQNLELGKIHLLYHEITSLYVSVKKDFPQNDYGSDVDELFFNNPLLLTYLNLASNQPAATINQPTTTTTCLENTNVSETNSELLCHKRDRDFIRNSIDKLGNLESYNENCNDYEDNHFKRIMSDIINSDTLGNIIRYNMKSNDMDNDNQNLHSEKLILKNTNCEDKAVQNVPVVGNEININYAKIKCTTKHLKKRLYRKSFFKCDVSLSPSKVLSSRIKNTHDKDEVCSQSLIDGKGERDLLYHPHVEKELKEFNKSQNFHINVSNKAKQIWSASANFAHDSSNYDRLNDSYVVPSRLDVDKNILANTPCCVNNINSTSIPYQDPDFTENIPFKNSMIHDNMLAENHERLLGNNYTDNLTNSTENIQGLSSYRELANDIMNSRVKQNKLISSDKNYFAEAMDLNIPEYSQNNEYTTDISLITDRQLVVGETPLALQFVESECNNADKNITLNQSAVRIRDENLEEHFQFPFALNKKDVTQNMMMPPSIINSDEIINRNKSQITVNTMNPEVIRFQSTSYDSAVRDVISPLLKSQIGAPQYINYNDRTEGPSGSSIQANYCDEVGEDQYSLLDKRTSVRELPFLQKQVVVQRNSISHKDDNIMIYPEKWNFNVEIARTPSLVMVNKDIPSNSAHMFDNFGYNNETAAEPENEAIPNHSLLSDTNSTNYKEIAIKQELHNESRRIAVENVHMELQSILMENDSYSSKELFFPPSSATEGSQPLEQFSLNLWKNEIDVSPSILAPKASKEKKAKVRKNESKEYSCDKCDYKGSVKRYLTAHKLRVHKKNKKNKCPTDDSLSSNEIFNPPSSTKEGSQSLEQFSLNLCKTEVNVIPSILAPEVSKEKKAKVTKNESKQYSCDKCDYKGSKNRYLTVHKSRVHENNRKFKCPTCNFSAISEYKLQEHSFKHLNFHKFECCFCDFRTNQRSTMKKHMNKKHNDLANS